MIPVDRERPDLARGLAVETFNLNVLLLEASLGPVEPSHLGVLVDAAAGEWLDIPADHVAALADDRLDAGEWARAARHEYRLLPAQLERRVHLPRQALAQGEEAFAVGKPVISENRTELRIHLQRETGILGRLSQKIL
ncbi:hypothetical protein, partial [Shinella sp.]|uniref:hypothetical protein n=1 Tax=Shinella sp. TaxID=1870904 RepID=UPI003F72D052